MLDKRLADLTNKLQLLISEQQDLGEQMQTVANDLATLTEDIALDIVSEEIKYSKYGKYSHIKIGNTLDSLGRKRHTWSTNLPVGSFPPARCARCGCGSDSVFAWKECNGRD
jgi:hypothetical protein